MKQWYMLYRLHNFFHLWYFSEIFAWQKYVSTRLREEYISVVKEMAMFPIILFIHNNPNYHFSNDCILCRERFESQRYMRAFAIGI